VQGGELAVGLREEDEVYANETRSTFPSTVGGV
jgi:hypothetical protein